MGKINKAAVHAGSTSEVAIIPDTLVPVGAGKSHILEFGGSAAPAARGTRLTLQFKKREGTIWQHADELQVPGGATVEKSKISGLRLEPGMRFQVLMQQGTLGRVHCNLGGGTEAADVADVNNT